MRGPRCAFRPLALLLQLICLCVAEAREPGGTVTTISKTGDSAVLDFGPAWTYLRGRWANALVTRLRKRRVFEQLQHNLFVQINQLRDFAPKNSSKFILHTADHPHRSTCLSAYNFEVPLCRGSSVRYKLLDHPNLLALVAENWNDMLTVHPKLVIAPIGFAGNLATRSLETKLRSIAEGLPPVHKRQLRVLSTAHFTAGYRVTAGVKSESRLGPGTRMEMWRTLKNRTFIDFASKRMSELEAWKLHAQYAFELCPEGNGLDTHRFYEAVLLGTIPIVLRGQHLTEPLYEQFPVAVIDRWDDLHEANLTTWMRALAPKMADYPKRPHPKLLMGHWMDRVRKVASASWAEQRLRHRHRQADSRLV